MRRRPPTRRAEPPGLPRSSLLWLCWSVHLLRVSQRPWVDGLGTCTLKSIVDGRSIAKCKWISRGNYMLSNKASVLTILIASLISTATLAVAQTPSSSSSGTKNGNDLTTTPQSKTATPATSPSGTVGQGSSAGQNKSTGNN